MTDAQMILTIIGANLVGTSIIMGMFTLMINKRIDDLRDSLNHRFDDMRTYIDYRFTEVERRLDALEKRRVS